MIQRSTIAATALCLAASVATAPAAATTEKQATATERQAAATAEKQGTAVLSWKNGPATEQDTPSAGYRITHGPYLQALTYDGVTVAFTTSERGFSRVEVRRSDDPSAVRTCVTVNDGLVEAWNTMNAIRIDSLDAATGYEYRIVSTRIDKFDPYDVRYGESVTTPWYAFRTPDPAARSFTFVAMNDIHDTPQKCRRLLETQPLDEAQMVFYVGDMMNYFEREDQPYESFIDVSTDLFARHKPFAVVRGNHETRGAASVEFMNLFPTTTGKPYYMFREGPAAFLVLDCGEDKPDSDIEYGGLAAYDAHREREAEWLRQTLQSDEFRSAAVRIVFLHVPPESDGWHGSREIMFPAADGVVTLAGDFYFAGRCVYVSHGAGFTTFYCHLSEISVKAGDEVKAGQTLGLSGKSGRVTGPHLHFSTAWRGIFFDPEPLLAE